jgi:DNA-binding transcriptional MerR regulator
MSHEIAKLLLEHAATFLERTEAIKAAISLGMPLSEIQDYLDWLDSLRAKPPPSKKKSAPSERHNPRQRKAQE